MLSLFTVLGITMDAALPDELINVDFRQGVAPFKVGAQPGVTYTHVDGTYRIARTTANGRRWSHTSVGEFVRTAYVVGVRAEVVEVTDPATFVGVWCLGPGGEAPDGLGGYGFFVAPGGRFLLGQGDGNLLKEGRDTRIDRVTRVSIECGRELDGDITVAGYANGLRIASASDPDGYGEYTCAGIGVVSSGKNAEVRFTRVWARIQDAEWTP